MSVTKNHMTHPVINIYPNLLLQVWCAKDLYKTNYFCDLS